MFAVSRFLIVPLCAALATTAQAASFQSLYSFAGGADGAGPYGKMAIDKNGMLYGTTVSGGDGNGGTVFRFDPASGTLTTLYAFTLGGATGSNPQAGIMLAGTTLYGVAAAGGDSTQCSYGCGTVFKVSIPTGKLTRLYSFTGLTDGSAPLGGLVRDKMGMLYGTTVRGGYVPPGGTSGYGTIFRLDPTTKALTTLHQFGVNKAADGVGPDAAMVFGTSGLLYGTASAGGPHGSGVVFSIDPGNGTFNLIHGFDYHVDGSSLDCTLIFNASALIGTTSVGGPTNADDGTVFSLNPVSGAVTTLYSFTGGNDGLFPGPGVVNGPKGNLYGTTNQGGSEGAGTAFALNPKTLKYRLEHDFVISDGVGPSGALTLSHGALYGVTSGGGRGDGTIFKIVP
jgi:uncharacterized repeat protein (TIGR03803 family)